MKRKTGKFFLLFVFASLAFSGCFSPWKGDEATLTLLLGGSSGNRAAAEQQPDEITLSYLVYIIELNGPTGPQSHTVEGVKPFNVTVMPGYWRISVRALLNTTLYARSESGAEIKAGQNNQIEIKMKLQLYTVTFNGNGNTGGTPPDPKKQSYPGEAITLPDSNNMSKAPDGNIYYEFICWNTKADGTGVDYKDNASYTPAEDITLYAKWGK